MGSFSTRRVGSTFRGRQRFKSGENISDLRSCRIPQYSTVCLSHTTSQKTPLTAVRMVAIGSMLFCDHCGSLMPRTTGSSSDQMIRCEDCTLYTKDTSDKVIVSTSKPSAFPSALRSKHNDVQNVNTEELQVESVTNEECPQCHAKEMFYHTKQLRSADEGSTVFYRCGECGYKFNTNN